MTRYISFIVDSADDALDLIGIAVKMPGVRLDDVLVDEDLTDDETADDIVALLDENPSLDEQVRAIADEHGITFDVALEALRKFMSDERTDADPTPPHGIERPVVTIDPATGQLIPGKAVTDEGHAVRRLRVSGELPPRPNPTLKTHGNSSRRDEAVRIVRDAVSCPTCGARGGEWCHGPKPGTYGTQHMHEARIVKVYGPR